VIIHISKYASIKMTKQFQKLTTFNKISSTICKKNSKFLS
jgi:hypothetical protein